MIIAIDFDGTLCHEDPITGSEYPNMLLIDKLKEAKKEGHQLILWTCRGDKWLEDAIKFCNDYGLEFDSINENVKGYNYVQISCKVVADYYIDDKSPGSIKNFLAYDLKGTK